MAEAVLLCGDSKHHLKSIETGSVDSVLSDFPYGIDFGNAKWDRSIPEDEIIKECFRVLRPGGYMVAFGAARTSHFLTLQLEAVGFQLITRMVWTYNNGAPCCQKFKGYDLHGRPKPGHEDIILVMKPILEKTRQKQREVHGNCGLLIKDPLNPWKMTSTNLQIKKPTAAEINLGVEHFASKRVIDRDESGRSSYTASKRPNNHPCVKPVELLATLARMIAPHPDATILDPFMGSGSTGLAALWNGYNFIGIELDEGYFDIAKARVEYALNNEAPSFPLTAAARKKFAKTERSLSSPASLTTPWLLAKSDLAAVVAVRNGTTVPAAEEYDVPSPE